MGTDTFIQTIDQLIQDLQKWKEKGYSHAVIRYGGLHGNLVCPSKKVPMYCVPLTLAPDTFKRASVGHIDPCGGNIPSCLVLIRNDNVRHLSSEPD